MSEEHQTVEVAEAEPKAVRTAGYLAEFTSTSSIVSAAKSVREAGYSKWDTHTPFPVHGLDRAMGLRPSPLGYIVFVGGLAGFALAWLMQWWMGEVDYPLNISGKPAFAFIPSIPVMFELTVLLSAFTCVGAMFALNRLPKPYNPLFNVDRFSRATDDRFFVFIDSDDEMFDEESTRSLLESLNPESIETVPEYE